MLLTGDARGDKILEGLEKVKVLKPRGKMHVDILKVPHHGSSRNMDSIFFERITADHYVFSGNGEHGNPDRETLQMLSDTRGDASFNVYLPIPSTRLMWHVRQIGRRSRRRKRRGTRT
jgi:beta-lactamase superfamily II metal-dependent hydrolase